MTELSSSVKLVSDDPKVAAEQVTEKPEEAGTPVSGELNEIAKPAGDPAAEKSENGSE